MNRKARRAATKRHPRADQTADKLKCPVHGLSSWDGHLACNFCKHVYHVHDLPPPQQVDKQTIECKCGARLTTADLAPICIGCAEDAEKRRN